MTVTCYCGRTEVLSLYCTTVAEVKELTALWQNCGLAVTITFEEN